MNLTTLCEHLLVIDFEATCDDRGQLAKDQMEIIEIGAVIVKSETLESVSEFQAFVRPIRCPRLTEFCTRLTSIRQSDVDSAASFPEVVAELKSWAYGFPSIIWASWGDYDQRQLAQDCRQHGIAYPLPGQHLNLKRLFSTAQGLPKKLGMAEAVRRVGLPLRGTHHRGIDDARNIVSLLPYCFER